MGIQVEELTRNLMPWGKEYIDFSFAGRHISEFGLVAVTSGDRYQFAGSPEFEDETSKVNGVWGQYYWGTNFKAKTYSYNLATDGMTERQFEEFKYHFRPGHYGQFYEDAWFDRYCYVRVNAKIDFSFIPFQEEAEVAGVKFQSRVYKGEAKISFIQDKPFKYSFYQVLDSKISELSTLNDNGQAAVRMMYNSNIPARDSWTKNVKCATGGWFSLPAIRKEIITETDENGKVIKYYTEYIEDEDNSPIYQNSNFLPYYNPSSIQAEANLEFSIDRAISKPNLIEWEPIYFNEIYDSITNSEKPYNTILVTDKILSNKSEIIDDSISFIKSYKYTLPEISAEINKAINIAWNFYQENPIGAMIELQERLQQELINGRVLLWAIKVLQKIQINTKLYCSEIDDENVLYLIDRELNEKQIEELEKNDSREVVFYSGDSQENQKDIKDILGCFKMNKIPVYAEIISNKKIEVDWFGYFNLMMLLMFGTIPQKTREDITSPNIFTDFYSYKLKFLSDKGQIYNTYKINYIDNDGTFYTEEIIDENCSNIALSDYLRLEGGDTLDMLTGKIATYHGLKFNRGTNEKIILNNIKLEYKYTYV